MYLGNMSSPEEPREVIHTADVVEVSGGGGEGDEGEGERGVGGDGLRIVISKVGIVR